MTDEEARELAIAAEIDRAVEDEVSRREASARTSALTALTLAGTSIVGTLANVAVTLVKDALSALSIGRTEQSVTGVVNAGFAVGRKDEAKVLTQEGRIVAKAYSAVMDGGTCEQCARYDGAVFPIGQPEGFGYAQAPNPYCYGTFSKCRCVWLYLTSDESFPVVGPSRGAYA